jgi:hypothetical protein
LRVFWQEEFDEDVPPVDSTRTRYQVSRSEIRNFIASIESGVGSDLAIKAGNSLAQTYSGFVHDAAPHIMEMCVEPEARFALAGVFDPTLLHDHFEDFWNYVYRGLIACRFGALALNDSASEHIIIQATDSFERASGTTFMSDAKRDA